MLENSLEAHVFRSDSSALAPDCRREIKSATARLMRLGKRDYTERRALCAELRGLAKEERTGQEAAVKEVIKRAQV